MTENFDAFPLDLIQQFVNENGFLEPPVTLQDLKQPTAQLVQRLYFSFIQEFGFSESLLMIPFDILGEIESHEIYKEMISILSLQAACQHLFSKLIGEGSFGVMDLVNPNPKKTQKFVSILQNFWLFCNSQYPHVEKIKGEVDKLVRDRADCEAKIEDYIKKINQSKSKAVEEKAEEEMLERDIDVLKEELGKLVPRQSELNEDKLEVKNELESQRNAIAALNDDLKKKETERDNLQGMFEGAATLQKLESELQDIRDSSEVMEKRKVDFKNQLELLSRLKEEYSSILEMVQQIAQEQQKARDVLAKIRDKQTTMETTKLEREEFESVYRELESQIIEKNDVFSKMKIQWSRRKKGKEEDLLVGSTELKDAKALVGEEQLVGIELMNSLRQVEELCDEEQAESVKEAACVRAQYSRLLEAIEKFNVKLNEDFKKIESVHDKLQNSAPAL